MAPYFAQDDQLSSFAVNPFAWNRDNSINSSVASLQVSDVKRSINATSALVKVKNLAIAEQVTTFTATSAGDISVDKRFTVKSNGSAVLLDILQADNVVGGLELLIRYQQAPQLEPLVFDYRFVHPNSTMTSTVCVVGGGNKATTTNAGRERVFIAAEVLAPNTIDFLTVFTKFDLVSNGAVFAAVIVIILLYLIMLLWARKADIKDNEKNRMFQLFNADDENRRSLVLRVVTASTKDAGTRSCVCFTLYFDEIDSGTHELTHPELKEFETGSTNNFLFSVPKYYGKPSHIKLWLNDGDPCDFWTINEISVLDLEKNQVYLFCVNSMLSYEMNIGQYGRRFDVKEERFSFGNKWMVHHALKGNFSEGHLWFSVFIRPFKTNFSRVQRISCCVTLLFLMMIANAMWFGKKQAANGAGGGVTVGPLSLIDILISLLSSLVEVPVSLVVVLIFRNSRSESERSPGQKSSWRGPWPGGCRCVAWCLVVLAVLSSGFFTILYSMEWGPEKANRWLVRFLSSFFISVILVQPVKNLVFAMGKCLLWKRNTKCQAAARGEEPESGSPLPENEELSSSGSHTSEEFGGGSPPLVNPPPGEDPEGQQPQHLPYIHTVAERQPRVMPHREDAEATRLKTRAAVAQREEGEESGSISPHTSEELGGGSPHDVSPHMSEELGGGSPHDVSPHMSEESGDGSPHDVSPHMSEESGDGSPHNVSPKTTWMVDDERDIGLLEQGCKS
ncbi:polycystin family receptor for egg jelly-like [Lampetra fluviatilis]